MTEFGLFNWIKKFRMPDLEWASDPFSRHDAIAPKHKAVLELKCRTEHFNDLMIEVDKWQYMLTSKWKPLYFCSTPEGIYYCNLRDVSITCRTVDCNATTEFSNTEKTPKLVGFIPLSQMTKLQ